MIIPIDSVEWPERVEGVMRVVDVILSNPNILVPQFVVTMRDGKFVPVVGNSASVWIAAFKYIRAEWQDSDHCIDYLDCVVKK